MNLDDKVNQRVESKQFEVKGYVSVHKGKSFEELETVVEGKQNAFYSDVAEESFRSTAINSGFSLNGRIIGGLNLGSYLAAETVNQEPAPWSSLYLSNNVDESVNRFTNGLLATAELDSAKTPSPTKGTLNTTESTVAIEGSKLIVKRVVDFPTDAANGTFQEVGIASINHHFSTNRGGACSRSSVTVKEPDNLYLAGAVPSRVATADFLVCRTQDAGRKLVVAAQPSSDLHEVEEDGAFTLKSRLKNTAGALVDSWHRSVSGDKLCCATTETSRIFNVWNLSNLWGNAISTFNLTSIFPTSARTAAVLDNQDSNIAYAIHQNSANDPVVNEPYASFIYKINLTTLQVLSRIRRPVFVNENYVMKMFVDDDFIYFWTRNTKATNVGMATLNGIDYSIKHTSTNTNTWATNALCQVNKTLEEAVFAHNLDLGTNQVVDVPNCLTLDPITGRFLLASNRISVNQVIMNLIPTRPTHRVVLPAPVTKVNTEVLKVTYTLEFDLFSMIDPFI